MKDTNRRIDLEVEELTRRICFESKPLWERIWIKFKRWFWSLPVFVESVILCIAFTCAAIGIICFINYLTTVLWD